MKKAFLFATILVSSFSFAGPVPKAIKTRYSQLTKVLQTLDFKSFQTFFSSEFVSVDSKGNATSRDEFLAGLKPMFEANKSGVAKEKLFSATTKNGVVGVKFDFKFDLHGEHGVTKVHEVGTDYWKKVNGTWVMVKTIDKSFTISEPKQN